MQRKADTSMVRRLMLVAVMLGVVIFCVIIVRLFKLQVNDYETYQQKAVEQQTRDKILYPVRGTIFDTNMKPLAISATTEMVTLEAVKIKTDEQGLLIAKTLSEILDMDYDTVLKKVEEKASYTVVKRGVEKAVADKIRAFVKEYKLDSIYMVADSTRYYPYGNFLAHVLGFVGSDEQGLAGLESQYEAELTGIPGRIVTATNARGDKMPFQYEMYNDAIDGYSLVLTIDEVLQHYLEKNLEIAVNDNKVQQKAVGIIMDVNTGGILAMAISPDFDPNEPFVLTDKAEMERINAIQDADARKKALSDARNAQWRNKAVSDTYYPGSTFKIITASVGLEEKAVSLSSTFYCSGSKTIKGWGKPISCWRSHNPHGSETFTQAIQNSCNPAFIEIGLAIGWDNMVKYHDAFGLNRKTGIDLPGEASGNWFLDGKKDINLAVGSFGQNFPITSIELITAVSAVANGGTLLRPHLVKEIIDSDGNIIKSIGRTEVRQVISKATSDLMRTILESVVTTGTGKNAYTAGYRVAGKTGTTEKIGSSKDNLGRISSFIAFAPADNPQIAVLILLDEPTVPPITGGVTVAPVIRRLMEEAMPYLNVEPIYTEKELATRDVTVPSIVGLNRAAAEELLKKAGLGSRTDGAGDTVTNQMPSAGSVVANSAKVVMHMGTTPPEGSVTMPDLKGMIVERAKSTLSDIGLFVRISGIYNQSEGNIVVSGQSAEKNTQVAHGAVITIELSDMNQLSQ